LAAKIAEASETQEPKAFCDTRCLDLFAKL